MAGQPKLDILWDEEIKFGAQQVSSYLGHLQSVQKSVHDEFGDVKIPEQLERAIEVATYLVRMTNHSSVSLQDEQAEIYVAALKWKSQKIAQEILDKKNKGASDEMLEPCEAELMKFDRILSRKAYQRFSHIEPIKEEMFIRKKLNNASPDQWRQLIPGKCFIVIPSDRTRKSRPHDDRYRIAIEPAVRESGYIPVRNTDDGHPNWFTGMVDHLRTCEFAVVDLTEQRPNCIWELGILNAWDVPVVLIHPEGLDLPSDIFNQRVSEFYHGQDETKLNHLKKNLKEKIKDVMSHAERGRFLPRLINGPGRKN